MGHLPKFRLQQVKPFINTGVDYAVPIVLKSRNTRRTVPIHAYIYLFVCMTTKALHLEIAFWLFLRDVSHGLLSVYFPPRSSRTDAQRLWHQFRWRSKVLTTSRPVHAILRLPNQMQNLPDDTKCELALQSTVRFSFRRSLGSWGQICKNSSLQNFWSSTANVWGTDQLINSNWSDIELTAIRGSKFWLTRLRSTHA